MTEIEEKDRLLFARMAEQAVAGRELPGNGLQRLLDALHDEVRLMDAHELAYVAKCDVECDSAMMYARLAQFEIEERRKRQAIG